MARFCEGGLSLLAGSGCPLFDRPGLLRIFARAILAHYRLGVRLHSWLFLVGGGKVSF
jgi:hypothetical protein